MPATSESDVIRRKAKTLPQEQTVTASLTPMARDLPNPILGRLARRRAPHYRVRSCSGCTPPSGAGREACSYARADAPRASARLVERQLALVKDSAALVIAHRTQRRTHRRTVPRLRRYGSFDRTLRTTTWKTSGAQSHLVIQMSSAATSRERSAGRLIRAGRSTLG